MTLYRQLIIFTFLLFLFLFIGTWYAKLESTRSFLTSQLESHVQDTATSLSLSISPHVAGKDMAAVESMINAVFDRGYYQKITFTDARQNRLIERVLAVKIEDVPAWFVRWLPLKTPEASSDVMAGWNQGGTISVKSHPGYAYATLWKDVMSMTVWFAFCAAFVLVVGGFGLRMLLKPLTAVERQADALCRKEYQIQEPLPWTREFRRVAEAMNRMTNKVKEMFEENVAQAEVLRERAYRDPLTGIGNRRYFESQMTARLDRGDSNTKGVVMLLQAYELEKLNQVKGFQTGDELLKRIATVLQESTKQYTNGVLARLTGGEFGFFLPDASSWDAEAMSADITNKLSLIAVEQIALTDNIGHVGAASYENTISMGRLLSEADLALGVAKQTGPNCWSIRLIKESSEKMPLGQLQWKDILTKALHDRSIVLDAQPVVKCTERSTILHLEIFSKIVLESGETISAGVFMPLAERLHLVSLIDRIMLEEVMKLNRHLLGVDNIAVNISPASLQDESFREWVYTFIQDKPANAPRLIFEFSEFGAVKNLNLIKEFSVAVRKFGHMMGLDHYGQSLSNLGFLQSLHPDYVKIDRAYTGELKDEESDSRFFIASLCSVAHSIDIEVIAEGVETEQQAKILEGMNLDAMQGYLVDRPKPVKSLMKEA
jgi:diguanylate cyclase (GGDEF)-like protein